MVTLTFIVCHYAGMINESLYQVRGCHPVQLQAEEQVSVMDCFMRGQIQMALWVNEHPVANNKGGVIIQGYTCEPTDRVKADL